MSILVKKFREHLRKQGLSRTLVKVLSYPASRWRYGRFKKEVLTLNSPEDRFTWIYQNNHWISDESASGLGSTLQYTENLRRELPGLFERFSIRRIFDAPCGDFNWMRHLLQTVGPRVSYTGGDIVRPLIDAHNEHYSSDTVRFIHIDLITGTLPQADLMICRDCLFHLSFADTRSVLRNFLDSGIPYLLTTTHTHLEDFSNKDIATGDFRLINLYAAPYHFPRDPLMVIQDWVAPDPERTMCLWSRDQVALAMP